MNDGDARPTESKTRSNGRHSQTEQMKESKVSRQNAALVGPRNSQDRLIDSVKLSQGSQGIRKRARSSGRPENYDDEQFVT